MTFQQVQKYEKGADRISASKLQKISQVLKIPIEHFFDEAPVESGRDPSRENYDVIAFANSPEGLELIRAFIRIEDQRSRRRLVALVEALAKR